MTSKLGDRLVFTAHKVDHKKKVEDELGAFEPIEEKPPAQTLGVTGIAPPQERFKCKPAVPRRQDALQLSRAEAAIFDASHYVEAMGASPELTAATELLYMARQAVAEHVDKEIGRGQRVAFFRPATLENGK